MQHSPLFNFIAKQNLYGKTEKEFLKQVARQHPYFTPAQFFLLQQTETADAGYAVQAAKTAVLFNNPFWLHYQLQYAGKETVMINEAAATTATPVEIIPAASQAIEIAPEVIESTDSAPAPPTAEQLMLAQQEDNNEQTDEAEKEIAPVNITIPNMKEYTPADGALAFEPMHLVDYFASQGIKLSDEVQTADKLGKQLKSFTEWLKTMKKIHIPDTEANAGISDIAVQALAAKSNKEGEIVTEAMAEVLVQQGKARKAIELYEKLSLLNPAKSAFFAAKIEQLKGS